MEGRFSTGALLEAAFKVGREKYGKSLEKLIEYGTAGFRTRLVVEIPLTEFVAHYLTNFASKA